MTRRSGRWRPWVVSFSPTGCAKSALKHVELCVCAAALSGILVGVMYPEPPLAPLLSLALFFMLWPAMLDIELSRLRILLTKPLLPAVALALNFIVSPVLVFLLTRSLLVKAPAHLVTGIALFGIMPCGGMGPAYTGLVKGNVELSLAITAASLLLSIGVVPLWTDLLIGMPVTVPFSLAVRAVAVSVALPLCFSWIVRTVICAARGRHVFDAIKPTLKNLSVMGITLMVFTVFAMHGTGLVRNFQTTILIGSAAFLFLTALMACSFLLGRAIRLQTANALALTISTTVKNNAVSLSMALLLFNTETAMVIAVSGSLVQLPLMLAFVKLYGKRAGL